MCLRSLQNTQKHTVLSSFLICSISSLSLNFLLLATVNASKKVHTACYTFPKVCLHFCGSRVVWHGCRYLSYLRAQLACFVLLFQALVQLISMFWTTTQRTSVMISHCSNQIIKTQNPALSDQSAWVSTVSSRSMYLSTQSETLTLTAIDRKLDMHCEHYAWVVMTVPVPSQQKSPGGLLPESGDGLHGS